MDHPELRSIRALSPDSLRGLEPAPITGAAPRFEFVDPRELYVEVSYQRAITEGGVTLIRRIYSEFNWTKFKAPICIMHPEAEVLVCIDGQHTAIACASHPELETIPVMIVEAAIAADRAKAFVGQNKDRLILTPMVIYRAELVAGDPVSRTIDAACTRAGVRILDNSINLRDTHPIGSTIAIGTMRLIARRFDEEFLTRVLKVLVAAKRGPVKAGEISAVALIFERVQHKVEALAGRLAKIIASKSTERWESTALSACADTKVKIAYALASVWCLELNLKLPSAPRFRVKLKKPDDKPKPPSVKRKVEFVKQPPARLPVVTPAPVVTVAPKPTPPDKIVKFNGVEINLMTREVTHRKQTVHIIRDEGIRTVVALARIMPGIIDGLHLANIAFGKDRDAPLWLRNLILDLNPVLKRARLEIRTVSKIGNCLADLDA